jgi:hypothetical protein
MVAAFEGRGLIAAVTALQPAVEITDDGRTPLDTNQSLLKP